MKITTAIIVAICIIMPAIVSAQFNLSAVDFNKKISELKKAPLVDVRTPGEFSKSRIKGAELIDISTADFTEKITKIDKSKPVLVYCLSGARSNAAMNKMLSLGFKEVYNLQQGLIGWRNAGLPEETGAASADKISKAQYDKYLESKKIVLIDFYAEWCAPCKKMAPFLEELKKEMADKLEVIKINADENKNLCKELGIESIPVISIFKNKKLAWTQKGFVSKEELKKQINAVK